MNSNIASQSISFASIQRYLQNRNWQLIPSKRPHLAIYYIETPVPSEILLPLDRQFADYNELIMSALHKISNNEDRPIEQVISDLMLPPSDVIRFRVDNLRTQHGLIGFTEGFTLLENARKSLFTTACDIIHPTLFHKRMSYKGAQQFIDSCCLGQTERGSFTASLVCPFINGTADDTPSPLSLFSTEEDLVGSFTRTVTKRYMTSLSQLKTAIENGNHQQLYDPQQTEIISANFIESIIDLGEYGDKEAIEISTSWSSATRNVIDTPQSITFTKDYMAPMESIVAKLKPKDEGKEGRFVGKVSKAQADPNPDNRSESEISFHFIGDEDRITKAKVFLNADDFSKACEALDKGSNVRISGKLKTSGKTRIIEMPHFELLN